MANAAEYVVKLTDKVSGPAKKATAAVNTLQRSTVKFNKAGRAVDSVTGKFVKMGGAAGQAGLGVKKLGGGIGSMLTSLAAIGFVAGIAQRALALLQQGVIALGTAFVKSIAAAESLQFSLTRFLGSGSKATNALKRVRNIANELGLDFQTAAGNFKNFISAGFSVEASENLLKFKADLLAMGDGSQQATQRIEEAFVQVEKAMATGRIEADQFNSILANLPVTKMQVLQKLADKTGQSVEALAKMDVTKLPVKELMESFQEASLAATGFGKLGEAAIAKIFSTVSGGVGFMKTRMVNVLDDLAARVGPAIGAKLLPVMQRLITFMQSPAFSEFIGKIADKLVVGLDSAIDAIIEFVDAFDSADPSTIGEIYTALMKVYEAINFVASAWTWVSSIFSSSAAETSTVISLIRMLANAWLFVANIIFTVVGGIADVVGAVLSFIWGKITWLIEAITGIDLAGAAGSVGSGIIDGITAGIIAGADAVLSALSGVVDAAVNAVKAKLGIASPSKVFAAIGENTALGYAAGIKSEAPTVAAASAGMVTPQAPSGGGGGGGNTVNQTNNISTTVNEAESATATAKEVKKQQGLAFADAMERLALELGTT